MIIGHEMTTFLMKGIDKAQPIYKHLGGHEQHLSKDTEPRSFHRTNWQRLDRAIYVFIKHHLGMLHDIFCLEVVQLTTMCSTQDQVSQRLLFTCFYLIYSHHNHSFVAYKIESTEYRVCGSGILAKIQIGEKKTFL